jgi:prepilin peptidase CpaA
MDGAQGFLDSLIGCVLPILVLLLLYALKMLGAGDIKLFSAIGAIMGVKFVLYSLVFSFLAGGIIAIIVMLVRRNFNERLAFLINYLKNCILTRSVQPYPDFLNSSGRFRFSYAIVFGTIVISMLFRVLLKLKK